MSNDDRYGDRNRERGQDNDRGFFERAGNEVRSWFGSDDDNNDRGSHGRSDERQYDRGYGRDPHDRNPGAHKDYYSGGDRGQRRMGPEGGFESREDYRRTDRYAQQGRSPIRVERNEERERFSPEAGSGGVDQSMGSYGANRGSGGGSAGPGFDPDFGGPRFDQANVGRTGTHGAHPVASPYGTAQTGMAGGGMGGGSMGGGSSARSRAILQQHEQQQGDREHRGQQGGGREESYRQQEQGFHSGGFRGGGHQHDPHYSQWRQRQIESLDRDYDEYRRENASRFESEFGSWREKRGQQRQSLGRAREQMEVVGCDGEHLGTVDKVVNERIILTKSDPNAGGHHHSIPCSWIENVDDKVTISKTADQAMEAWRDEDTSRALFERPGSGSEGPHILERSFSGTYKDE